MPTTRRVVATSTQTGATNIVALDVTVTNRGASPCTTQGWATVALRGTVCNGDPTCDISKDPAAPIVRAAGAPPVVTLAPDQSTTFSLTWTGGTLCPAAPAAIEVTLPHGTTPLRLSPVDLCATGDDGSSVEVTPLGTTEQWHPAGS